LRLVESSKESPPVAGRVRVPVCARGYAPAYWDDVKIRFAFAKRGLSGSEPLSRFSVAPEADGLIGTGYRLGPDSVPGPATRRVPSMAMVHSSRKSLLAATGASLAAAAVGIAVAVSGANAESKSAAGSPIQRSIPVAAKQQNPEADPNLYPFGLRRAAVTTRSPRPPRRRPSFRPSGRRRPSACTGPIPSRKRFQSRSTSGPRRYPRTTRPRTTTIPTGRGE